MLVSLSGGLATEMALRVPSGHRKESNVGVHNSKGTLSVQDVLDKFYEGSSEVCDVLP